MISVSGTEVFVKVVWNRINEGWGAVLLTADESGFNQRPLHVGDEINIEVTSNRRCVGYTGEDGKNPCPDFNEIDSGRQCYSCRNRDVHIDYVEGRSGEMRDGEHSVYLAQVGDRVKVGVTRNLIRRWVEQGAVYAVEIKTCDNADEALQLESQISDKGIDERISKISKSQSGMSDKEVLIEVMESLDVSGDIVDVQAKTIYPSVAPDSKAEREGKFSGSIECVRGQLLFTDGQCLAVTKGREIRKPVQSSITDF